MEDEGQEIEKADSLWKVTVTGNFSAAVTPSQRNSLQEQGIIEKTKENHICFFKFQNITSSSGLELFNIWLNRTKIVILSCIIKSDGTVEEDFGSWLAMSSYPLLNFVELTLSKISRLIYSVVLQITMQAFSLPCVASQ